MRLRLLIVGLLCVGVTVGAGSSASADACPTYNPPTTLTLAAGTPQSAKLGTPYETNLRVTLVNTNGCPITTPLSGIAVTFAAPGSGPSGTFASSGSNAVLIGTDGTGSATAPAFTANSLPGGYLVTASSDYGSVVFSLVNTAVGVPATVTALSPPSEKATISTRYADPLQVKVLDANGTPVQGASVTFALGSAGGANGASATFEGGMAQATETTNDAGVAKSPLFSANATAGGFTASASVGGGAEAATFALTNLAAKIIPVAPTKQSVIVGRRYHRPLEARVIDSKGQPVQGASVTFILGASGGGNAGSGGSTGAGASFVTGSSQATATTTANGIAISPAFTANTTPGTFTATATTTGTSGAASFSLDNLAGKAPSIRVVGHASRSARVGSRYASPLKARVRDADGKPVQGVTVTFVLGSSGGAGASGSSSAGASFAGGATQATATTNAGGLAVSPRLTANTTAGTFTAAATTAATSAAADFSLRNLAGKPSTITAGAASTESTAPGHAFPVRLAVKVEDAHGNVVKGVAVRFSAPAGGSTGRFRGASRTATVKTDAAGVAVAPEFLANTIAGGYVVRATVHGVAGAAAFALVNAPS